MIKQLGLENEKPLSSPGVDGQEEEDTKEEVALVGARATEYRGIAARMNYLAADRPDMQYAVKETCRDMASPTEGSWRRLMRI